MDDKKDTEKQSFIGAQYGVYQARNYSHATNEMIEGMDLFRATAERLGSVGVQFKKGNLFEYIEAAKFNSDAARHGSTIRAQVTAANGDPTGPVDILLEKGGGVLAKAQLKSADSSTSLANYLKDEKYNDMLKVVPKDKAEKVRAIAEGLAKKSQQRGLETAHGHADTARNVSGELKYGGISSEGTTYRETIFATEHAEVYAAYQKLQCVAKEAGKVAGHAAAAGVIIGGAISVVQNSIALANNEISANEAVMKVGKDALQAGFKSSAVGASGAILRAGAKEFGVQTLTKSNVAAAVASGTIESGISIYRYIKGEISGTEAMECVGKNGASTMASIYAGAAAGMIFGPLGGVIGSVAGYMMASNLYQSTLAIMKEAKLAKEESMRAVAVCEAACLYMKANRLEFESSVNQCINERKAVFEKSLRLIDTYIEELDYERVSWALADFALLFGEKILGFEVFDKFMLNTEEKLQL